MYGKKAVKDILIIGSLSSEITEDNQKSSSIAIRKGVHQAIACARLMDYDSQSSQKNDNSKYVSFVGSLGNNEEAEAL